MEREFKFLKKRYNLTNVKMCFDPKFLSAKGVEAFFDYILVQIILKDGKVCKKRLLSLLHEICHAIQLKEKRLIINRRDIRKMYLLDREAELFAIMEYEKIFAKKYGHRSKNWTLAPYEEYKELYKNNITLGYGKR